MGTQSVLVLLDITWSGDSEPAITYYDDQFLSVPEPHAALLELAVIGCLAILTRRRSGFHDGAALHPR